MLGLIEPGYSIKLAVPTLVWLPEYGIGYLPSTKGVKPLYDAAYFDTYLKLSRTSLGRELTAARVEFVSRFYKGEMLDFGIGSGQFISSRGDLTYGWDINPEALKWLSYNDLLGSPGTNYQAISFWDSLEHLEDPAEALSHALQWAFVSMPVFKDLDHIRSSKHFKPGEHLWYFTLDGFEKYVTSLGFEIVCTSNMEIKLGREDIWTFALSRG
jgi:hypothetical protein